MTSPRGAVLLTGATGLLGGHLLPVLEEAGWSEVVAIGGPTRGGGRGVDLADPHATGALLRRVRPRVVIHAAALAAASDCLADPARARRINVDAAANLAHGLREHGGRLVHVSTDLVFDGEGAPYDESAAPAPVSVYGRTKAEAEAAVLATAAAGGDVVVVRTSLLFGPTRTARRGFFDAQVNAIANGEPIVLFEDEWRTPLALGAAAASLAAIAASDVGGALHLGGPERMSRFEMGVRLARLLGRPADRIAAGRRPEGGAGEPRPRDVSLDSARFRTLFPGLATARFEDACVAMGVRAVA